MKNSIKKTAKKSVLLCILDGWGVKKGGEYDAISKSKTPNFDKLIATCPHSNVKTYGLAVGLPEGQMGNSEVGHMNIGGGRVVMQSLPMIDQAIASGEINNNKVIQQISQNLAENGKSLHLMGLLSDGGVHAHIDHIIGLAKIYAEKNINVKIHIFSDGRDTSPQSAKEFVNKLLNEIAGYKNISVASISGRYFAMDRDNRWDRVEKAYNVIVSGNKSDAKHFENALTAIEDSHYAGKNDEFIEPVTASNYGGMEDGDAILMANFRADRAREILNAIMFKNFDGFARKQIANISICAGLVEYSKDLAEVCETIFEQESLRNTLGEIVSLRGGKQLRIAETEKYAHVTFFFNGGIEKVFEGEERILVPSPKVATYDLQPEMNAREVTDKLIGAIESGKFDLIVCNYANPDMVGHTGILSAAITAVEAIDECLGRLIPIIEKAGGAMIVTADHGNVEEMLDENGEAHTQHTVGDVPFILFNGGDEIKTLEDGRLCDIAPTILKLMGIEQPSEMNGKALG